MTRGAPLRGVPHSSDVPSPGGDPPDVPPMNFSLMGRFFAVPLVIISTIVGGAILVVLLFGGPAAPDQRTIEQLLQALETNTGERNLGLLLTREKEMWQTALELGVRLENKHKDAELQQADLAMLANRLGAMVDADLDHFEALATSGADRERQREYRSERLRFLILALGRTEQIEAVAPLLAVLERTDETYSASAVQALGYLHEAGVSRNVITAIIDELERAARPETKLVACTVLSVLTDAEDEPAVQALISAYRAAEGDVEWNCALALARLGDATGRATLLDLMDREFLERDGLYETKDGAGVVHRYPLPPQRVQEILIAAIDAGAQLGDPEVFAQVRQLAESDRSPAVREHAAGVLRKREQTTVRPRTAMKG